MLNCWFLEPKFKEFVVKAWEELQCEGWGSFVLKEKLKGLKAKLKVWNKEVFGDLNSKRNDLVLQIEEDLDRKEEDVGLLATEVDARRLLCYEFWAVLKLQESLLCQKSISKWLKEGDHNTKYFHSIVNWRRRTNSIAGLMIDES